MGMVALFVASVLLLAQQDPSSVPDPDPTEQDAPFELSMPGSSPTEVFGEAVEVEELFTLRGTVVAIDSETVTLRRRGEIDADFSLTDETAILMGEELVTFDLLPPGTEVEVLYELRGADRIAREIRATPPAE
jgi:hypothetical protein